MSLKEDGKTNMADNEINNGAPAPSQDDSQAPSQGDGQQPQGEQAQGEQPQGQSGPRPYTGSYGAPRPGGYGGGGGGPRPGGYGGGGGGPRPGGYGGPRNGGGGDRGGGGGGYRGGGGGGARPGGRSRERYVPRRKVCSFCVDKVQDIDYKDVNRLKRYLSERAKIEPRRKTGTCARHQRALSVALKRARHMALLPYIGPHSR